MVILTGCQPQSIDLEQATGPYPLALPPGFPDMPVPTNNELTYERVRLGRQLFFDPILSRNSTISCASCHQPRLGFTDGLQASKGIESRMGSRNAPSLGNIGYHPYFLREGGVPTLEQQVAVPVQEAHEFDFNFPDIVSRLNASPTYVNASQEAYHRDPDAFVVTRALGAFQRTLITGSSPWDRFFAWGDISAVSPQVLKGWTVFQEKGCASCHGGFDFTDYSFENIGLYLDYPDQGRSRLTNLETDNGKFKVPSLRNVAITAPYMHDGQMQTLEEVLDHFASGGKEHPNRSIRMSPFTWKPGERNALIAFLEALTDAEFIANPAHRDPHSGF